MSSKELEELFLELLALGTKDHLMRCAWEGANPEAKALFGRPTFPFGRASFPSRFARDMG